MSDPKTLYARIEELERERDEARARVAAAYEEAADVCPNTIKSYGIMKPGKPDQFASREAQMCARGFVRLVEEDIRALATDEERDALAERDARIRAEERDACAKVADGYEECGHSTDDYSFDSGYEVAARHVAAAIRAPED